MVQLRVQDAMDKAENVEKSLHEEIESLKEELTKLREAVRILEENVRGHVDVYNQHVMNSHMRK